MARNVEGHDNLLRNSKGIDTASCSWLPLPLDEAKCRQLADEQWCYFSVVEMIEQSQDFTSEVVAFMAPMWILAGLNRLQWSFRDTVN